MIMFIRNEYIWRNMQLNTENFNKKNIRMRQLIKQCPCSKKP